MTPEYMLASLTNQTPTQEQINRIETTRRIAYDTAMAIFDHCPSSPERTIALRKLEESIMYAVKSIVMEGVLD